MLRPPRNKGHFEGNADAAGSTSLSNPYAEADGRRLRRRYAFWGAVTLILIAGVIAMIARRSGGGAEGDEPAPQAPKHAYTLEKHIQSEHIDADIKFYTHTKSGMKVMSVVPSDKQQDATFGISFRTPPTNNRGQSYIVEQCVKDGSENYPIKDPFNQLFRGSLQTFMDSWTDKDRTSFAFSSRNLVDFRNGVKVHLDAMFKPLFTEEDAYWIFRQEAWRLESPDNENIELSGNAIHASKASQMKADDALMEFLYQTAFEGHSYGYNPNGDFHEIVELTHKELGRWYNKHYHPANGRAFCYGPESYVKECMNLMDPYLAEYEFNQKLVSDTEVGWVRLTELGSGVREIPYPSYQDTKDYRVATAYVVNDQPMDAYTQVSWLLLEDLLVGSPAAALSRVIIELALGDDVIGHLEHHLRQWTLVLGVSGVPTESQVEFARDTMEQKLVQLAANGFHDTAIAASLNKLQMNLLDPSSESEPQGVKMFRDVLGSWTYDHDPIIPLMYASAFAELKENIEKNGQQQLLDLLTMHIIDNNHKLTAAMYPSSNVAWVYDQQEQAWLDKLGDFVTDSQARTIMQETAVLVNVQATPDSQEELNKISPLSISDLAAQNTEIPTEDPRDDIFDSGITMLQQTLPTTNGIAYVDFAVDISKMDFADVVLIPLFCNLLWQAGNSNQNGVQFQRLIDTHSGGITVHPLIEEVVKTVPDGGYVVPNGKHMVTKIVVRGSCLASTSCQEMFVLMKQILFEADVQQQAKVIELLEKMIEDMEDDIQDNGHIYTTLRVKSQFSLTGFVEEQWKGISQLLGMRRVLNFANTDWDSLSTKLVLMQDIMKRGNRNGMLLSVTGDKQAIADIYSGIEAFVVSILPLATQTEKFPDFGDEEHPWVTKGLKLMQDETSVQPDEEAILVPTRVNHVGKGGLLFDPGERMRGSDLVVLQFIGGYYLYDQLRFGLGAAEAWVVADRDSGAVIYQSDRDPNIVETLDIYEGGASWIAQQVGGKTSLPVEGVGAVIGAIGALDGTALQPSRAGYIALVNHLKQDTAKYRQHYRHEILTTTVNDFMSIADRLGSWGNAVIVVITNEAHYNEAKASALKLTTCDYTGTSC